MQRFEPYCARPWFDQAEAQIDTALRDDIKERSHNIMRIGRIRRAEQTAQLFFKTVRHGRNIAVAVGSGYTGRLLTELLR